VYASCTPDGKQ
jgi:hypothetical protein